MKPLLVLPIVVGLLFASCSHLTPAQQKTAAAVGGAALDLAQHVVDIAVQVVVMKATSDADLSKKSDLLDSAAVGLRSLESNTGGLVTPGVVAATVSQFTDPTKTHWGDLANQLSAQVSNSSLPPNAALEAVATGLNTAAATSRISAATP